MVILSVAYLWIITIPSSWQKSFHWFLLLSLHYCLPSISFRFDIPLTFFFFYFLTTSPAPPTHKNTHTTFFFISSSPCWCPKSRTFISSKNILHHYRWEGMDCRKGKKGVKLFSFLMGDSKHKGDAVNWMDGNYLLRCKEKNIEEKLMGRNYERVVYCSVGERQDLKKYFTSIMARWVLLNTYPLHRNTDICQSTTNFHLFFYLSPRNNSNFLVFCCHLWSYKTLYRQVSCTNLFVLSCNFYSLMNFILLE